MLLKTFSLFRFCSNLSKNAFNSINPVTEHVAYAHYIPKEWEDSQIFTHLDPTRKKLTHVQIVKNKLGQASGKVLLKFSTAQALKACVQRFNQDFILTKQSAHRVVIKPFQLRTQETGRGYAQKKTKHQVKIKNLDFDISEDELRRLAKDFGQVAHVELHIRPNGLNNGIAAIYFQKRSQAVDFAYFCQGLLYKERKLGAEVVGEAKASSSQANESKSVLPRVTMQSHEYIYKKCLAKDYQASDKASRVSMDSKSRQ